MLLRHIDIYLSTVDYDPSKYVPFSFRARTVGNFLERRIRPLKFASDGFGKFLVCGHPLADRPPQLESVNCLVVEVPIDLEAYSALEIESEASYEVYLAMLLDGLDRCRGKFELPFETFESAVGEFRAGGYRNEWCQQKKLLRPTGLRAFLLCSMDQQSFRLRLRLERKGEQVFDRQILETKPDETIYKNRFKELRLTDEAIEVVDPRGKRVYAVPLNELD